MIGVLIGSTATSLCVHYYDRVFGRPYDTLVGATFSNDVAKDLEIQPTGAFIIRFTGGDPQIVEIVRQWDRNLIVDRGELSDSQLKLITYWFNKQRNKSP